VDSDDAIFILGIMPRSGTNFLWDLLCFHPQCAPARAPIREDFFLEHSHHLLDYAQAVRSSWDPMWGPLTDDLLNDFRRALGDGLIAFLRVERAQRLLTKSPSVKNLEHFFDFFPQARLLILVRDGRSVVHSCVKTFGWQFDTAARKWADAADEVTRFDRNQGHRADRYRIVRYEDLVDDTRGAVSEILNFLELDPHRFDFESAERLPVRGSSEFLGPSRDTVHWDPVEKDSTFAPKERWRAWDIKLHQRFEWLAGDQLRELGYEGLVAPVTSPLSVARHRALDAIWGTKRSWRRSVFLLRGRFGQASRPLRRWLGRSRAT
jgi:Sulfotransferase family